MTVEEFVDSISSVSDENCLVENPYRIDVCRYNLLHYLQHLKSQKVDLMLIGEAPGYRGCAMTGIPFTDEIQLSHPENRYALGNWSRSGQTGTTAERSASIVWPAIRAYHLVPLLWNVFPFHPYQAGNRRSNRTPTQRELREGRQYIEALREIFQIDDAQVFAIGRKAQVILGLTDETHCIRHPANDFQKEFRPQFDLKVGELFLHRQH